MDPQVLFALDNAATGYKSTSLVNKDKVREVAEQFEAVFLAQFLDSMFSGIETAPPFGGGMSEDIFRSVLNQEIAGSLARTGAIGIADSIQRELIRLQEVSA